MKIKNYIQFIKESSGQHKWGCVMIEFPISNWNEITSMISPNDVYEEPGDTTHGIEDTPHVTILYGLHPEVTDENVKEVFDNFKGKIIVEVEGIDIFENPKFDVVKFNVKKTDSLQYLHDELSKFPNSNEYPDYKPHITVAYVKPGTGKKYVNPEYKYKVQNVDKVVYSKPSGEKTYFNI